MRSVRCEACGTKALTAASKCPKCGHPIDIRDGFGELLPLAHCPTCDSYYPHHLGECRWCGTKPEPAPLAPYVWKGVGVLAFVSLAVGAWLVRDYEPADTPASLVVLQASRPAPAADADTALEALAEIDTIDAASQDTPTTVVADAITVDTVSQDSAAGVVAQQEPVMDVDTTLTAVDSAPVREPTRAPPRTTAPARTAPRAAPRATPREAPRATPRATPREALREAPRVAITPKASTRTPAKTPARASRGRWVNSVARSWVIVRADASRSSRIIGSVGPDTRVQLGESRGAWRRIRAKGLSGWVEHRLFPARASAPRRARRYATR